MADVNPSSQKRLNDEITNVNASAGVSSVHQKCSLEMHRRRSYHTQSNEKLHAEAKPFELVGRRTGEKDVQDHTGAPHVRLLAVIHQAGQHLRARPGTILFHRLTSCLTADFRRKIRSQSAARTSAYADATQMSQRQGTSQ